MQITEQLCSDDGGLFYFPDGLGWQVYGIGYWQPMWIDFSEYPPLQKLKSDAAGTSNQCVLGATLYGVQPLHVTITLDLLSGNLVLSPGCSSEELASVSPSKDYQAGQWPVGCRVVERLWEQWQTIQKDPDWQECYGKDAGPFATFHFQVADLSDKQAFDENILAEEIAWQGAQAQAEAMASLQPKLSAMTENEGDGMMLMDSISCTITDEASPFAILSIEQDTNRWTTVTWESCSDHAYGVLSVDELDTNTAWLGRISMWGEDGSSSWTDTTTLNVDHRFYKVRRMPLLEGFSTFSFTINGDAEIATNVEVELDLFGLVADYVVISESVTMANNVTNQFVSPLFYTLADTNDGLHTIYMQLMNANGTLGPVFGRTFELDTHPPTLIISSPSNGVTVAARRVNIQGFAADATTNAPVLDASRQLRLTVNDVFVNERDTNGNWWAGPQELVAGTNTFIAVATDHAGFSVSNSVWFIYDPSLATNVPAFTVDVIDTITVASNTTSIAVSGWIDDDNATITIDVLDATDNTITNATISAAMHGTNWWGEVPVLPGSNIVVITAQNSGSLPATNTFTAIQDANVWLEITSPAAGTSVNATNVTVTGLASANFDSAITVNGQTASTSVSSEGISFSATIPINNVDANIIEVRATGSDGSSASQRQIVYGYEMVAGQYYFEEKQGHADPSCWYLYSFPDSHPWFDHLIWDERWAAPGRADHSTGFSREWNVYGGLISSDDYDESGIWASWTNGWPAAAYSLPMSWFGTWRGDEFTVGKHVSANDDDFRDCPYQDGCGGYADRDCCLDTSEHYYVFDSNDDSQTFVKHWPVDEEQTVILHFHGMTYWTGSPTGEPSDFAAQASQITLWGQTGFVYAVTAPNRPVDVGFLVKIKTNTRYTLRRSDFTYPSYTLSGLRVPAYNWSNPQTTFSWADSGHMLEAGSLANCYLDIWGRSFTCPGTNVAFKLNVTPAGTKVKWEIVAGSDTSGNASVDENTGVIRPGPNPGSFTVKASRLDDPNCSDTQLITVLETTQSSGPSYNSTNRGFPGNKFTDDEIQKMNDFGIALNTDYALIAGNAAVAAKARFWRGNENADGNIGNAFQHAFWNWMQAKHYGIEHAKALTDAHENYVGNRCEDKSMDLSNNKIGIDLYQHYFDPKSGKTTISDDAAADILDKLARRKQLTIRSDFE